MNSRELLVSLYKIVNKFQPLDSSKIEEAHQLILQIQKNSHSGEDININTIGHGELGTVLSWAAYSGQKQIVQYLLEAKADPNIADIGGSSRGYIPLLQIADRADRYDILCLLLEAKSNVESCRVAGHTALTIATSYNAPLLDNIVQLLKYGAKIHDYASFSKFLSTEEQTNPDVYYCAKMLLEQYTHYFKKLTVFKESHQNMWIKEINELTSLPDAVIKEIILKYEEPPFPVSNTNYFFKPVEPALKELKSYIRQKTKDQPAMQFFRENTIEKIDAELDKEKACVL